MSALEVSLRLERAQWQQELAKTKAEAARLKQDLARGSGGGDLLGLGSSRQRASMAAWRSSLSTAGEQGGGLLGAGMVRGLARFAGPAALGGSVIAGLRSAVMAANADESLAVRMRVLVGDADTARELTSQLRALGARTPLEFGDLAAAGQSLIAFGEAAGNVPAVLERIGDVASGVSAPIGEIAEIYGKARVQGTLFAEDINQLTGRGIPVIQEFARIMGVTEGEVKKLASEGKVTFPMLEQAFRNLTGEGGKFNGMMAEQAKTASGMWSTLKDELGMISAEFGKPLAAGWKSSLEAVLPLLGSIRREMRIMRGDGSVFTEEQQASDAELFKRYNEKKAQKESEKAEAALREKAEADRAEVAAKEQREKDAKTAKERTEQAGRVKDLRNRVRDTQEDLLPDDKRLEALGKRMSGIFVDAQLSSGQTMTPTLDGLRGLAEQQRKAGNLNGEEATLKRLQEALEIQREMERIQEGMRERGAALAEAKAAENERAAEEKKREEEKTAAENQRQAEDRSAKLQAQGDLGMDMEILRARAGGDEKRATELERRKSILGDARQIAEQTGLSPDQALALAGQRATLTEQADEAGGKSDRYDSNGRRADGRKRIRGFRQAQGAARGFSGLDAFYADQQVAPSLADRAANNAAKQDAKAAPDVGGKFDEIAQILREGLLSQ